MKFNKLMISREQALKKTQQQRIYALYRTYRSLIQSIELRTGTSVDDTRSKSISIMYYDDDLYKHRFLNMLQRIHQSGYTINIINCNNVLTDIRVSWEQPASSENYLNTIRKLKHFLPDGAENLPFETQHFSRWKCFIMEFRSVHC